MPRDGCQPTSPTRRTRCFILGGRRWKRLPTLSARCRKVLLVDLGGVSLAATLEENPMRPLTLLEGRYARLVEPRRPYVPTLVPGLSLKPASASELRRGRNLQKVEAGWREGCQLFEAL